MGKKLRYLIPVLIILSQNLKSQENADFHYVDSLTYSYYSAGRWSELKKAGNDALKDGIDYKFLRQRLGYAYYIEGDYVRAAMNFEKAFVFDSYDPFTISYLYYTGLYLLKPENAGYYADKISPSLQDYYKIKPVNLAEDIDFEFSFKVPSTHLRSNPLYYRFGIGSRPVPRLGIYQSVSAFSQDISVRYPTLYDRFRTRQFEYYIIARYGIGRYLSVQGAYHLMYTDYTTASFYTNIGYASLVADYNLFNLKADASVSKNVQDTYRQAGIRAAVRVPGKQNFIIKGGAHLVSSSSANELIYTAGAGVKLSKKLLVEGDFALGNMNYFNDFDALYVYNSMDPIRIKTGVTASILKSDNITLWIYLGGESKEYFENETYYYNQFTFLGGLRWRH
jgi:hypothetical protein